MTTRTAAAPVGFWARAAPEGLVAGDRYAGAAQAATAELDLPPRSLPSVGEIPGFTPLAGAIAGQPDTLLADRTAGAPMDCTSGTTGRPKGVRRPPSGKDPDAVAAASGFLFAMFAMFGIEPEDGHVHICGSPRYHTAVLAFSATSLHYGHPVVLMDKWDPADMLLLIERHGGDPQPHGPHPVPPAAGAARGRPRQVRRVVATDHGPRRRPLPRRDPGCATPTGKPATGRSDPGTRSMTERCTSRPRRSTGCPNEALLKGAVSGPA